MRHKLFFAAMMLTCAAGACAPRLGDGCSTGTDCSVNGDRFCDLAQPGGYCTIADCEPGSCGGEGVCVRFRPEEPRLSRDWCMAKCGNTGDCDRDAYVCRSAEALNKERGDTIAQVLDRKTSTKFCVVEEE